MQNLTDKQFGRLTVLGRGKIVGHKHYWRCRCACGVVKEIRSDALCAEGGTRSCGCLQIEAVRALGHHHARGERFSRLVIIRKVGTVPKRGGVYLCACDCGRRVKVQGRNLRNGLTGSCGCRQRDIRSSLIKHGQARAKRKTPIYNAYHRQKYQCQNPHSLYARYFYDKGVQFLFESFAEFYADVGDKPGSDYWLVRINGSGPFSPGNLEWREIKRHRHKRKRRKRYYPSRIVTP
jgi:hypothetical protein